MWQSAPPSYSPVFIPIEKSLLFRFRSHKNNPEGRTGGLLRNAYRSWFFSKRIQEIEAVGVERDLVGLPVMECPMEILDVNATGSEAAIRRSLEDLIQRIRRDENEGALIPPETDRQGNSTGYKLKLLSSGGKRNFDTDAIIRRYETRIAQSVLSEFIMLGTESVGSFALASSKTKMFSIALGALRDSILSVFNRFAIPRLMEMNGQMDPGTYPTMVSGDFDSAPLDEIAQYVTSLASVGAINIGPKLERKLLELGNLPEEEEEGFDADLPKAPSEGGLDVEADDDEAATPEGEE